MQDAATIEEQAAESTVFIGRARQEWNWWQETKGQRQAPGQWSSFSACNYWALQELTRSKNSFCCLVPPDSKFGIGHIHM